MDEHNIATATGFFWRHFEEVYLVTNWHVLSGREPRDRQPKSVHGAVPNALEIDGVGKDLNTHFKLRLPLENGGKSLWVQHRTHGAKLDVAMLHLRHSHVFRNIDYKRIRKLLNCINDFPQNHEMQLDVGQDIFVVGFPLNILQTKPFPIWKRASIATEPNLPIDGLPCFLIDTATREGMSGAPVIQMATNYRDRSGTFVMTTSINFKLIGIYSGRHIGDLNEAQLGIVWNSKTIEEIINDSVPGENYLI